MDSNFLKYLRRTKNDMLIYFGKDLTPIRYEDYDFQLDPDFKKSTSGYVFTQSGGAIIQRSVKQSCIVGSTMEAEYVVACEAAKEAVWLQKFLIDFQVALVTSHSLILHCDNSETIANLREPRSYKKSKIHLEEILSH